MKLEVHIDKKAKDELGAREKTTELGNIMLMLGISALKQQINKE